MAKEASSKKGLPKFNPDDCHNPVCGSKMDMFKSALAKSTGPAPLAPAAKLECPVDREELGRSTWNLLHTTAAYYPEKPSDGDKTGADMLIRGLAAHYPCEHCAEDFREAVAEDPPMRSLGSRASFMLWACRQHNLVNDKLGKPLFKCDVASLDRRWKYGGPGCWSAEYDGYAHETLGKEVSSENTTG